MNEKTVMAILILVIPAQMFGGNVLSVLYQMYIGHLEY